MKPPVVLIVCNALDDVTRRSRRIHTDSPAASRKVFLLAKALRMAGGRPYVLSLGRGRPDGSLSWWAGEAKRIGGIPVVYSPFSHFPLLSAVASLFGLVGIILRLAKNPRRAVVFYNRMGAYAPALIAATVAGYRRILDLEDGELPEDFQLSKFKGRIGRLKAKLFDLFCGHGALLACTALTTATSVRPVLPYYGTATAGGRGTRWQAPLIRCLMSGTLVPETGASLLIEAIVAMRSETSPWVRALRFEITGKGSTLQDFEALATAKGFPEVVVHGRTTDQRYLEILTNCEVGLALKPVGGAFADTTFPSKVVEFAGAGLLVLTTDVSDVRSVLSTGGRYLISNDPSELITRLRQIVENREAARATAGTGQRAILELCAPVKAGRNVMEFIFWAANE